MSAGAPPRWRNLEAFRIVATQFVQQRGWPPADVEDLVSEMVLEVLAQPERSYDLGNCYQHAYDRLDPRTFRRAQDPRRVRKSARLQGLSLDAPLAGTKDAGTLAEVLAAPADAAGDPLLRQWLARQVARLEARTAYIVRRYFWDDVEMHTIGAELGLTEGRISQVITETLLWLGERYYASTTDEVPVWGELCWRVEWITL